MHESSEVGGVNLYSTDIGFGGALRGRTVKRELVSYERQNTRVLRVDIL